MKPDVAALLPKLMWYLEEPISDSAIMTTYLVSDLAAREVKVILSGVGGDELFAGYKRYLGDHYTRRFLKLPQWLRRQVVRPLTDLLPSGRHNRWADLARYARKFMRASELPWRDQYREFMEIQARAQLAELLHDAPPAPTVSIGSRPESRRRIRCYACCGSMLARSCRRTCCC